jgi:hypothetical protein
MARWQENKKSRRFEEQSVSAHSPAGHARKFRFRRIRLIQLFSNTSAVRLSVKKKWGRHLATQRTREVSTSSKVCTSTGTAMQRARVEIVQNVGTCTEPNTKRHATQHRTFLQARNSHLLCHGFDDVDATSRIAWRVSQANNCTEGITPCTVAGFSGGRQHPTPRPSLSPTPSITMRREMGSARLQVAGTVVEIMTLSGCHSS